MSDPNRTIEIKEFIDSTVAEVRALIYKKVTEYTQDNRNRFLILQRISNMLWLQQHTPIYNQIIEENYPETKNEINP